jgi:hypothetical protein
MQNLNHIPLWKKLWKQLFGAGEAPSPSHHLPRPLADLANMVERFIVGDLPTIAAYVNKLRQQNPGISDDELATKIVRRKAIENALCGTITAVPGFSLTPLTAPASIAASWRIQAHMVLAIAHVYGYTRDSDAMDLKRDIYILLAGNQAKEALRRLGIEVTTDITRQAVQHYVTRRLADRVCRRLGQKLLVQACSKSLTSFTRLTPLVAAPVSGTIDWASATAVGRLAIHYYSGKG